MTTAASLRSDIVTMYSWPSAPTVPNAMATLAKTLDGKGHAYDADHFDATSLPAVQDMVATGAEEDGWANVVQVVPAGPQDEAYVLHPAYGSHTAMNVYLLNKPGRDGKYHFKLVMNPSAHSGWENAKKWAKNNVYTVQIGSGSVKDGHVTSFRAKKTMHFDVTGKSVPSHQRTGSASKMHWQTTIDVAIDPKDFPDGRVLIHGHAIGANSWTAYESGRMSVIHLPK